jgi:hypothetical protein
MMEAARTSETLVNFYQTTRCYNPEDSNLQLLSLIVVYSSAAKKISSTALHISYEATGLYPPQMKHPQAGDKNEEE